MEEATGILYKVDGEVVKHLDTFFRYGKAEDDFKEQFFGLPECLYGLFRKSGDFDILPIDLVSELYRLVNLRSSNRYQYYNTNVYYDNKSAFLDACRFLRIRLISNLYDRLKADELEAQADQRRLEEKYNAEAIIGSYEYFESTRESR